MIPAWERDCGGARVAGYFSPRPRNHIKRGNLRFGKCGQPLYPNPVYPKASGNREILRESARKIFNSLTLLRENLSIGLWLPCNADPIL